MANFKDYKLQLYSKSTFGQAQNTIFATVAITNVGRHMYIKGMKCICQGLNEIIVYHFNLSNF